MRQYYLDKILAKTTEDYRYREYTIESRVLLEIAAAVLRFCWR